MASVKVKGEKVFAISSPERAVAFSVAVVANSADGSLLLILLIKFHEHIDLFGKSI